jgi:dihydrofolate synthase/folylpolyglutamate synthase
MQQSEPHPMSYQDVLAYLYKQLPMYHRIGKAAYKADLTNTLQLMELLGHPEKKIKCIHVAGTNGKGSASHMLASVLQSAGYKTGLYTSPHLLDFRERIRINGEMIPEELVVDFVHTYRTDFEKINLSFFEWTVGLCFAYFAEQEIDIAIIETGLGGRLDSTNVVTPLVSVITNIALDHTDLLGETIPLIAREKAGIVKNTIPVVIGERSHETDTVFLEKAARERSKITFAEDSFQVSCSNIPKDGFCDYHISPLRSGAAFSVRSPLTGQYQIQNLTTVLETLRVLSDKGFVADINAIKQGIESVCRLTGLMGRWQTLDHSPLTIADTGHNLHGINRVVESIQSCRFNKLHVVLGFVAGKQCKEAMEAFPLHASFYLTKPSVDRALPLDDLAPIAQELELNFSIYPDVEEAWLAAKKAASPEDMIFIGGSTFVVADALALKQKSAISLHS